MFYYSINFKRFHVFSVRDVLLKKYCCSFGFCQNEGVNKLEKLGTFHKATPTPSPSSKGIRKKHRYLTAVRVDPPPLKQCFWAKNACLFGQKSLMAGKIQRPSSPLWKKP